MLSALNINEMKRLSVLTAAVLSIGITSTQVFGGDGRNGPETNGNAIPVQVDRVLTVADLVAVAHACDLKLIDRIYTQIFKVEKPPPQEYALVGTYRLPENNYSSSLTRIQLFTETTVAFKVFPAPPQSITLRHYRFSLGYDMDISSDSQRMVGLTRSDKTIVGSISPLFMFDEEIPETAYDELGRLQQNRVLAKNPIIALPSTGLKPIKDFIGANGKIVPLEVNVEEYKDCLLAGIQKKD